MILIDKVTLPTEEFIKLTMSEYPELVVHVDETCRILRIPPFHHSSTITFQEVRTQVKKSVTTTRHILMHTSKGCIRIGKFKVLRSRYNDRRFIYNGINYSIKLTEGAYAYQRTVYYYQ